MIRNDSVCPKCGNGKTQDDMVVFFAAPAPPTPPAPSAPEGVKHDATKARWDLVPWAAMTEVVHVLTHGAAKYAPGNWRKVPDHRRRYLSAALRHMTAWAMGEIRDTESGRPHLAHAVCCLLFLLEREGEKP